MGFFNIKKLSFSKKFKLEYSSKLNDNFKIIKDLTFQLP